MFVFRFEFDLRLEFFLGYMFSSFALSYFPTKMDRNLVSYLRFKYVLFGVLNHTTRLHHRILYPLLTVRAILEILKSAGTLCESVMLYKILLLSSKQLRAHWLCSVECFTNNHDHCRTDSYR